MNPKLLEQLALAKQAGTQAMAKDFFAKTPSAAEPDGDDPMAMPADVPPGQGAPPMDEEGGEMPAEGEMSPEELEQLIAMMEQKG